MQADILIVNGEGTVHDSKEYAYNLIKVAEFASRNNIKAYFINGVYQNNSDSFIKYMNYFEKIYVRETMSKNELDKYNIKSVVVPDLSFGHKNLFREFENRKKKCNNIIYSDSVYKQVSEKLYKKSKMMEESQFITMRDSHFNRSILQVIKRKLKYLKDKKSIKSYKYSDPLSLDEFLKKIYDAKLIITGRFHLVCLCILAKTPFIAVKSNTHKIEGLLNDIGLQDRIVNINNLSNKIDYFSKFRIHELKKIEHFNNEAIHKIDNMFKEIK